MTSMVSFTGYMTAVGPEDENRPYPPYFDAYRLNKTFNEKLAVTGILNPVVGALVHNAGSVVVIIHSALLLRWSTH